MTYDKYEDAGSNSKRSTSTSNKIQTDNTEEITSLSTTPCIPMPTMTGCNIEAFFYSLKFWFEAVGITKDWRKFFTVCATLPPHKLMELKSVVDAATANKKYDYIKKELIKHLKDSDIEKKRVQKVLSEMTLGDRKPIDLYKEMKRVAGTALSDTVILEFWSSRLSTHVQHVLITTSTRILEKLKIADSIVETINLQQGAISEIQRNEEISELRNDINQLSREMKKLLSKNNNEQSKTTNAKCRCHASVESYSVPSVSIPHFGSSYTKATYGKSSMKLNLFNVVDPELRRGILKFIQHAIKEMRCAKCQPRIVITTDMNSIQIDYMDHLPSTSTGIHNQPATIPCEKPQPVEKELPQKPVIPSTSTGIHNQPATIPCEKLQPVEKELPQKAVIPKSEFYTKKYPVIENGTKIPTHLREKPYNIM